MAKITYTDKTTANTSPLPTTQKFRSADANEIKASVNALYDEKADNMIPFVVVSSGDIKSAYRYYDDYNSKPRYVQVIPGTTQAASAAASNFTRWSTADSEWQLLGNGGTEYYTSTDAVATPDLVTTWVLASGAVAPLPTVDPYYGTQQDLDEVLAARKAPKIYRAILSQSGTDAPTAVVLENTLGGVPVLTRDSEGYYLITLAGAFLETKIFIDCPRSYMDSSDDAPTFVSVFRLSNNACAINTLTSDGSIKEMNAVTERSLSLTIYTYP